MNVNPFSYLIEKLKGKVDKSGDTMTGQLVIKHPANAFQLILNRSSSNTVASGSYIEMGNNIPDGTAGSSFGAARIYGVGTNYTDVRALSSTANRTIEFPDASGTLALTSDLANYLKIDLTTYGTYANYVHDFNDITTSGIYWCYCKYSDSQNQPAGAGTPNGVLIVINSGGDGITQLFIERTSGHIYSRGYRSSWSAWIAY